MSEPAPLCIAVEDELSEVVILEIIRQCGGRFEPSLIYCRGGAGYLRKKVEGFNRTAQGVPFFVLTDLDQHECPPGLVASWLRAPKHSNFIFRVAVREVEAWVMAHRKAFAEFLGIALERIPVRVEEINNPKEFLVGLARRSRRAELRRDLVPRSGSTAKVGRDYNGALSRFVTKSWNALEAAENSESLRGAMEALRKLEPSR